MEKTKKKGLGNKGFSLVELIVVIAIMAILVGVLAPTLIGNIEKSRYSKDKQALDGIFTAVQGVMTDEAASAKVPAGTYTLKTFLDLGAPVTTVFGYTFDTTTVLGKLTSKAFKNTTTTDVSIIIDSKGNAQVTIPSKDTNFALYTTE